VCVGRPLTVSASAFWLAHSLVTIYAVFWPLGFLLLDWLRIGFFDLALRHHLDLRLPLVQFDCARDPDDLPLQRRSPAIAGHFRGSRYVARERLVWVCSAEIQESVSFLAGEDGNDQAADLDVLADVLG
jgi:hypothetical protein